MSRGIRYRLMAFVVLSAIGITYVTATYLGLVDRVTGRDLNVTVTLPQSGGLFEGSEVTYRGVKIGKISTMATTEDGIELELTLDHDVELPTDSSMYVHNLSAVGEQYLDFQPSDEEPPYAKDGTVFKGDESALPVDEGDLLVDMNDFVGSVDRESLQVVVKELGEMFGDTGRELQTLLDSGSTFVREASAHTDETVRAVAQRADGAPHPERPEGEHPQLRQRPQHPHQGPARQRRGPPAGARGDAGRPPVRWTPC